MTITDTPDTTPARSSKAALLQQEMTVFLAGKDEPIVVTTANPDLVRWDMTRGKHKWPPMDEAPMLWATFVAWAAAKRLDLYSGTWEEWSGKDALSVEFEDGEDVDPTQPALEQSSELP